MIQCYSFDKKVIRRISEYSHCHLIDTWHITPQHTVHYTESHNTCIVHHIPVQLVLCGWDPHPLPPSPHPLPGCCPRAGWVRAGSARQTSCHLGEYPKLYRGRRDRLLQSRLVEYWCCNHISLKPHCNHIQHLHGASHGATLDSNVATSSTDLRVLQLY